MFIADEKYQQILEALPDGMYILDRNLIIHYANPAIVAMLKGFGLEVELVGNKFTDVLKGAEGYLQGEVDMVYETGKPMMAEHTVNLGRGIITYETVRIPLLDSSGIVQSVLNTIHDITNRLRTQKELEDSRRMFETMVDNANSIVLRMDLDGRVTYFNSFAEQFFGFSREEIIGRSVQSTIIPEIDSEGKVLRELIMKIVADPAAYASNENENMKKDGSRVWVSWSNKPVYNEAGEAQEILAVGNDITALKNAQRELIGYRDHLEDQVRQRTEELVRADRLASLGTLVSGVAHEINNPNNFIILNGDNLADIWKEMRPILDAHAAEEQGLKIVGIPYDTLRSEMDHLIGGIREGARRIRTIVAHLKDFARQGPLDMEQEVDLAKVIEAGSVIVANAIKKCTGNYRVTVASNAPKVKGNFQKLEQVVINLLTNACQALTSRDQEVTVTVKSAGNGTMVSLSVSDKGKGIPPEILPRIFDPFFTTKRDSGGTGLGLSISYGIVKDHKGAMEVKSEVGKGTEFIVTLPAYSK